MGLPLSRLSPAIAIAAFALAGSASAALYKWTDASGRVVYSDQPPTGNMKVETLSGPPPPANPNAAKELANKEMEYKQRQIDAQKASEKADKERTAAKDLADNCRQAKGTLQQLGTDQLTLYRVNEKGERVMMDEATKKAERDRITKWMRDSKCPS